MSLPWDFDIFNVSDSQLLLYVCDVYKERGLMQTFNIDDATLEAVARPLQKSGYGDYLLEQLKRGRGKSRT